jgi:hypothetical protein
MTSPESKFGTEPWRPVCFCLGRPNDAALETVSQYIIFPDWRITTIKPGTPAVAVDRRTPRGGMLLGSLHGSGMERVKVSEGDGDEAGTE